MHRHRPATSRSDGWVFGAAATQHPVAIRISRLEGFNWIYSEPQLPVRSTFGYFGYELFEASFVRITDHF